MPHRAGTSTGARHRDGPGPLRLMVVDDHDDIRLIISRFATADGRFEVVGQASDGLQAVKVAAATRPDVVILDVQMPNMCGIETIPHLRAVSPDSRIVMYSSDGTHADDALELGAHAWHTKNDPLPVLLATAARTARDRSGR